MAEEKRPHPPEMDLREFMELGYLQEANRRFFHPLGLALFARVNDHGDVVELGCYDDRGDPEGWRFDLSSWPSAEEALARFKTNAATIEREWDARQVARAERLGYVVQPATGEALLPPPG
jgi:hypothetical protein